MIERYLRWKDYPYLVDRERGFFQVGFARDVDSGRELTAYLSAVAPLVRGALNDVYPIRVYADKSVPRSDWGRVVMRNAQRRWPRAHLETDGPDANTTAEVVADWYIDLEEGVHKELLSDLTDCVVAHAS